MPIDDFLNVTLPPPVGAMDLGVPELPQPPQAPVAPPQKSGLLQTIMQAGSGILGGALGPGAGTGLLQGMVTGQQRQQQEQQQQQVLAQRQYQMEQQAYSQQAQQHEQATRQREAILQQNLTALRSQVKDLPDKQAYDAYIEAYGQGLQGQGFRLDANWLRKAVPFVVPEGPELALRVYKQWMADPINQQRVKDDPNKAMNDKLPVPGLLGPDEPTPHKTVKELRALAGIAGEGADGEIIMAPKGVDLEKFSADIRDNLLEFQAQDKAEGVQQTDKRVAENIRRAREAAEKAAKDAKAEKGPSAESETRKNMRIQSVQTRWDNHPLVKDYNTILAKAQSIQSIIAGDWGGPGDLAVVYEFMKAMDPTSVVRETEYASAAASGNIFAGAFARFNGTVDPKGGFLSPHVKQAFLSLAQAKLNVQRAQYENLAKEFGRQIDRVTGEPGTGAEYLTNYANAFPTMGGEKTPATGGPQVGERRMFNGQVGEWDGKGWKAVP